MSEVSTATRAVGPENRQRFEVFREDSSEWLEAQVEKQEGNAVHIIFHEQGSLKRKKMNLNDPKLRIAEAGLQRPAFLVDTADITEDMRNVQRSSPTKWAMTLRQWNEFIDHCKGTTAWKEMKKKKHVNLYDMNERFIIPWTRGTGCSVAILMNKDAPKEATVMLSHAWGEDMEECQSSINEHFEKEGISPEAAVWFCGFGIYQPQDGLGPTIQEQLALNPFTEVISSELMKTSPGRMLAVHTTGEDLWERLWCVREVREAMDQDVPIRAALSDSYKDRFRQKYDLMIKNGGTHLNGLDKAGVTVRTARAKCGRAEDEEMLVKQLTQDGKRSLDTVDKTTTDLRINFLKDLILEAASSIAMKGQPKALLDLAKLGDVGAVDGLHAVAEAKRGSEQAEQARDALCEALECSVRTHAQPIRRAMYVLCWKDRQAALELPITLLQSMASMHHQKSVDILSNIDFEVNDALAKRPPSVNAIKQDLGWGWSKQDERQINNAKEGLAELAKEHEKFDKVVDKDAWCCQHAQLPLQILAKQGNECALAALVAIAKRSQGSEPGRNALKSLAEQWNRQALKALKAMAEEETTEGIPAESYCAWSRNLLKRLEEALRSGW